MISPRTRHRSAPGQRGRALRRAATCAVIATLSWTSVATVVQASPSTIDAPLATADLSGLRSGSTGASVVALQRALIDAGVDVDGGADGVFGPGTRRAVVEFQTAQGLPATGDVDDETARRLAGGTTTPAAASDSASLDVGAEGDDVRNLQNALIEGGVFLLDGADGVFGAGTTRAITQFQRWNGLAATGVVDSLTAQRLGLARATRNPEPDAASQTPTTGFVGLATGARGDRVTKLQEALQSIGLVVRGGADGVFGPATASALKAFQGFNGLPQDGVLSVRGAELLGLTSDSTESPSEADPVDEYIGLAVGARGDDVKDVQRALMAAGITVRGGADGVFGNATKSALATYQSSIGLSSTGSVDRDTAEKLGLGSDRAPESPSDPANEDDSHDHSDDSDDDGAYVGLKVGDSGPLVTELQRALQSTGLVVRGGADGSFGNATKSALQAFQSVNGIEQTGIVTARGASILGLGTGQVGITNPDPGPVSFTLERFPIQGLCFFGDTWHAPRGNGRLHVGVDIIADEGKLLYAVADGEITKLFWDQPGALAGNGVRLTQPDGTYYIYLHMLGFAPGIEVGTKVKAGDVIGFNGNTGSSATAHLHFEIHPGGGAAINPYPYIKAIDDCSNTTPQFQSSFS